MPSYYDYGGDSKAQSVIEKATEMKRAPIVAKEKEIKKEQLKMSALDNLSREMSTLSTFAGRLYGFNSIFNSRLFLADTTAFEGSADRIADLTTHQLKVIRPATKHILSSKAINLKEILPASEMSFSSGAKTMKLSFRGGDLMSFFKRLQNAAAIQKIFDVSLIKRSDAESVLVIGASKEGVFHTIRLISDSGEVMKKLGMFSDSPPVQKKEIEYLASPTQAGVKENKKQITLGPISSVVKTLKTPYEINHESQISITLSYKKLPPPKAVTEPTKEKEKEKTESPNYLMTFGLTQNIGISNYSFPNQSFYPFDETEIEKGLEQAAAKAEIAEPTNSPPSQKISSPLAFILHDGVNQKEFSLNDDFTNTAEGSKSFLLSAPEGAKLLVQEIEYFNKNEEYIYTFSQPELIHSPKNGSNTSRYYPANELSTPLSSLVLYKGVTVERDNNEINDLITGVTLNLKNFTEREIPFEIKRDDERISQEVINFVGQYNIIVQEINLLMSRDPAPPDVEEAIKNRYGLFQNDSTLRMLRDKLRMLMTSPYPTADPDALTMFKQLGISTIFEMGKAGDTRTGTLEMNEDEYKATYMKFPSLVPDLFGFDKDGDKAIDSGAAFEMAGLLSSYTRRGGLIDITKSTSSRRVDALKKEIESGEKDVDSYRKKLEKDFAEVERSKSQMESMSKYFDSMNKQ